MAKRKAPAPDFDGRAFAAALPLAPGVYRMFDAEGGLLYVGKARALRNRVGSYFNATPKATRIMAMLAQVARIETTVTRSEADALLLENQLIKSLQPRYNVMLRDDKSYPFVLLTKEEWPRLGFHRGPRAIPGRYFGPYPSAASVRETLNLMHKLFRLRSCEDSVFRNRSRPCLQYQIGRCSAPCVARIEAREYADAVRRATLFLEGRSQALGEELADAMQAASDALEFEEAARLRDLIATIRKLQARQTMDGRNADLDVLAVAMQGASACVLLLAFRDGRNLGTRAFFPRTNGEDSADEVLAAFVSQYYAEQPPPAEIVLDREIPERELIEQALSGHAGRKVELRSNVRGERAAHLDLVRRNAELALATELTSSSAQQARVEALRDLLGLADPPQRIECFDISHTLGEATVASCVVFDANGPVRSQYRRYNIATSGSDGIAPGDDYAAMHQALRRRFRPAAEGEPDAVLPDVLLIDGGVPGDDHLLAGHDPCSFKAVFRQAFDRAMQFLPVPAVISVFIFVFIFFPSPPVVLGHGNTCHTGKGRQQHQQGQWNSLHGSPSRSCLFAKRPRPVCRGDDRQGKSCRSSRARRTACVPRLMVVSGPGWSPWPCRPQSLLSR